MMAEIQKISGDWVFISRNDKYDLSYNPISMIITKTTSLIEGWVKHEATEKGKKDFLESIPVLDKLIYKDYSYSLLYTMFDYRNDLYWIRYKIDYNKSGGEISTTRYTYEMVDIIKDSESYFILKKILEDKNILR